VAASNFMLWAENHFELSRGTRGKNLRQMEGMRGLAVFLVFLVHNASLTMPFLKPNSTAYEFAGTIGLSGNIGVDIFFVLSGFLIYGSLISKPQPFLTYMKRRVQRIYPAFLAVLCVYILLSFLFPSERKIPQEPASGIMYVLENLLLLPGLFHIRPIIIVAWSLSYEMFYYLLIPLTIYCADLRNRRPKWRIAFFTVLLLAFLLTGSYVGWPLRLGTFVAGIITYELYKEWPEQRLGTGLGLLGLAVAIVVPDAPFQTPMAMACKQFAQCAGLGIFGFAFIQATPFLGSRFFSWTPLRWLGNISYSYYLIHGLAINGIALVLRHFIPSQSRNAYDFFFITPVLFVLTLPPSVALYLTIERPLSLIPRTRKESTICH
jgi:exopolysaccharide production protein ExoZ